MSKSNGSNGKRTSRTATPRRGDAGDNWQPDFLNALRVTFNVRHACRMAVVSRDTAYRHRRTDPDFRADWDKARDVGLDTLRSTLEENSLHRAIHGTREGIWYKGRRVGWKINHYPVLEMFFLERLLTARYFVKPQAYIPPDPHRLAAEVAALAQAARWSVAPPPAATNGKPEQEPGGVAA